MKFNFQVSALKIKMNDPDMSKESRDSYSNVAEKAVNMTESIKHAIVLLQVNPYYFRGKLNIPVDLGFFFAYQIRCFKNNFEWESAKC